MSDTPSIHPDVRIGHVHLKVADLDRALAFYCGVLGFQLTQQYGRAAAFISAGGYHHHIGLNTWESLGGSPPPRGSTGLYHLAILYPTRAELADALLRLIRAGISLDGASDHGVSEALYLRDPDDNGVELYWDRPREKWPRAADGAVEMFTRSLDLDNLLAETQVSKRQLACTTKAKNSMSIKVRAAGAVMGALIGDALAVGPHWYYDLDELRRDYGDWITGYTDPKPHRYHAGLKAGQLSQAGIITTMLLRSVVDKGGYEEDDFCRRLDEELFPQLDGKPMSGPGGYTSQSIREAWRRRVEQKKSWKETGGHADTTEAAERALVLAARYAKDPAKVAKTVRSNCLLTQADEAIVCDDHRVLLRAGAARERREA